MTARLPPDQKKTPEQRSAILKTAWARGDRRRARSERTKALWAAGKLRLPPGFGTAESAARGRMARAMRAAGRMDALTGVPLW